MGFLSDGGLSHLWGRVKAHVAENAGAAKILWRGGLLQGGSVSFNVPESCFHNNSTTLTLVIESYMKNGAENADFGNAPIVVVLSFGEVENFGMSIEDDGTYYPYNSEGYATALVCRNIHESMSASTPVTLEIKAKKTATTEYCTCYVKFQTGQNSSPDVIITNISAYVPADMG